MVNYIFKFKLLVILIFGLITTSGCRQSVTLHPIMEQDIFSVKQGAVVTQRNGKKINVQKDGWYISDFYMEEVAKARVENANK